MKPSGVTIHMRSVPGKPKMRELDFPLVYKKMNGDNGVIPAGFAWDGSSVPWFVHGFFPRFRHPIASCRHDFRCKNAENAEERAWADKEFKKDVRSTSWAVTSTIGYLGVRIGAFFGVGCRY